jgi:hypothetical protein
MYTYDSLDCHFNQKQVKNTAAKIRGSLCAQGTYWKGPGVSFGPSPLRLDGSRDDQAGRLIFGIGDQESQNYSSEVIRLKSTNIRWFSLWSGGRLDLLPGGRGPYRVQNIVTMDRGLKRRHRALEGDRWLKRRQRAIERTVGRGGTEDHWEGRGP